MDRRLFLFQAIAATVSAQENTPEANASEKALRERVQHFYELQKDKKYREAEAMVADDTKDIYYASKKPDVRDFTVGAVQMMDNGTKAKVIIKAKVLVLMPGVGAQVLEMPSPTEWKLENGEWRWYISEETKAASPFGQMRTGGSGRASLDGKGQAPGGIEHPDVNALDNQITIDRTNLVFTPGEPSQTVTISNGLPGPLDIRVDSRATLIKGLTVKIDKPHLNAGEKATIMFRREGSGPLSDFVPIIAEPLNKVFTVTLSAK